MKKILFIVGIVLSSLVSDAQNTNQNPPIKEKKEYSFLWGIFKSIEYPKSKSIAFEIEHPKFSNSLYESDFNSTKHVRKSFLWGAIQWTEKKTVSKDQ